MLASLPLPVPSHVARYHERMTVRPVGEDSDTPSTRGEATRLLHAAAAGGDAQGEKLLRLVHDELRALADRAMASERADHTLQPTALVHEAWLKLFDGAQADFRDRNHFLATAARAMRHILVDHARARRRMKRGGELARVELASMLDEPATRKDDVGLVELDQALDELRARAPRQVDVVELRYFGGLSVEETAAALSISERTVAREWRFARAWLSHRLEKP